TVDFVPERPPVAEGVAMSREVGQAMKRRTAQEDRVTAAAPPPPAPVMAEPVKAQSANVAASDFHAIYSVPGRVTVDNTGEIKRVQIDETQLEPNLMVRAVPKREERAYLYAKLVLPKTSVF